MGRHLDETYFPFAKETRKKNCFTNMLGKVSIDQINAKDKRVLIRVDFNVPQDKTGKITNDQRIVAALPTVKYALDNGKPSQSNSASTSHFFFRVF